MLRERAKYYCWKYMKYGVPYTVGGLAMVLSSITFGLTKGEITNFLILLSTLGYVSSAREPSKQGWITKWKKAKDVSFNEILERLRTAQNARRRRRSTGKSI